MGSRLWKHPGTHPGKGVAGSGLHLPAPAANQDSETPDPRHTIGLRTGALCLDDWTRKGTRLSWTIAQARDVSSGQGRLALRGLVPHGSSNRDGRVDTLSYETPLPPISNQC